ncbi:MAG: hypothetical protein ABEL51_07160, partial [Salinibacter sp.]
QHSNRKYEKPSEFCHVLSFLCQIWRTFVPKEPVEAALGDASDASNSLEDTALRGVFYLHPGFRGWRSTSRIPGMEKHLKGPLGK